MRKARKNGVVFYPTIFVVCVVGGGRDYGVSRSAGASTNRLRKLKTTRSLNFIAILPDHVLNL